MIILPEPICPDCGCQLIPEIDADPDGKMSGRCKKCLAEYEHDFDTEPDAVFDRAGQRLDKNEENDLTNNNLML